MKKVLSIVLVLITVLVLSACDLDLGPVDAFGDSGSDGNTTDNVESGTKAENNGNAVYIADDEYPHSGTVEGGNYPEGDEPVSWFDAEVLSVSGSTILVAAHEGSWVKHRCADQLYVTTKLYSGETLTGFEAGDLVRITYNGMIAESYPAQIFTVYEIAFITTPADDVPSDFSFSMTWGVFGISSYDSKTGKLIKTTDATHPEDYVTEYFLSDEEFKTVYGIIEKLDVKNLGEFAYGDFGMSDPHLSLSLTVKTGDIDKTITVPEASLLYDAQTPEAKKFLDAIKAIRDILVNTDEWKALPDYENFYD